MSQTFTDTALGLIEIRQNPRARRCILRLKTDRVLLTVPAGVSQEYALGFLREKSDWVLAHKEKVQQPPGIISGAERKDVPPLQTLTFSVNVQTSPRKKMLVSLQNGVLNILVPQTEKVESEKIQRKIHQGIEAALRFEAKRILPEKLKELSEKHALPFLPT